MVVERFDTFLQWLLPSASQLGSLVYFGLMVAGGVLVGIFIGFLVAAFRHGLGEGFYSVATVIAGAIPDFAKVSPRRVMAVAHLAVKESIRARVVVAFALFLVVLMYARWFLDTGSDDPAKLYMLFVINATTFLVLVLAVFISTFSLPADIKNRTIYTVVTKPVRATEVVLGRMIGFSAVATVIIFAMGTVGYVFIVRSLTHEHQLEAPAEEITAALETDGQWSGFTTMVKNHRHGVTLTKDGVEKGEAFLTENGQDHRHEVFLEGDQFVVSRPVDQLQARVPKYGELSFKNRTGEPGQGISVGKEWTYRKYIQGETLAAGIWAFSNIRAENFNDELPLEMTLSVFRTFKGDMSLGVKGSITLRNPETGAQSVPRSFYSREFDTDQHFIPRTLQAVLPNGETVAKADLFEDLCDSNGNLEVWVRCEDRNQYFGMAQGDLYVLEAERPFATNYFKGFLAIWMQMVLVICFGVMISTRLNGAISMLATLCYIVVGSYRESIVGVFKGMWSQNSTLTNMFGNVGGSTEQLLGGGPIESVIRLITQKNLTADLDMGWLAEGFIRWADLLLELMMMAVTHFAPNFSDFNTASYLAEGYDINGHVVATQGTTFIAYLCVMLVVGYFFLKTREIAAA